MAPSPARRLEIALSSWAPDRIIAFGKRVGLDNRVIMRAKHGREVNPNAYLTLCAGCGIHPVSGRRMLRFERKIEVAWWIVAASLVLARAREEVSNRDLEAQLRMSRTTISRIENETPVGVDAFLKIIKFIGAPWDSFTSEAEKRFTGNACASVDQQLQKVADKIGALA